MYDYGNARIAALRGRLLDPRFLRRLQSTGSPAGFLALLERADDWESIVRDVQPLAREVPQAAIDAAIDRHRATRLSALPRFYDPPVRGLVVALVLPLDVERVVAIVRRRWAGEAPDVVGATIIGGAILDTADLGEVARAPSTAASMVVLGHLGLVASHDSLHLAELAGQGIERGTIELALLEACERARLGHVTGRGADARYVRRLVLAERAERASIGEELRAVGAVSAALLERTRRLASLDQLTRQGRRDVLGIGVAAAYVAAVQSQAIRLRAIAAGLSSAWPLDRVGAYLGLGSRLPPSHHVAGAA